MPEMKHRLYHILALLTLICSGVGAKAENLFVYPTPPDTMQTLQQRSDYFISRFWDRCNFGSAMANPEMFNKSFGDWLSLMPHASADTVHAAVNTLLARFEKKGPETLALVNMAENWMWSDTASYQSEELYTPFLKAAVANKKISNADKARYRAQLRILESSAVGAIMPDFTFVRPDGSQGKLSDATAGSSILIFINDPDCDDCNMARVRLSADFNTRELIDNGKLTLISITPDEATAEWREAASAYPANWLVGAMEDADALFDLRYPPVFVYLDSDRKVLAKNLSIDHLLAAFQVANTQKRRSR